MGYDRTTIDAAADGADAVDKLFLTKIVQDLDKGVFASGDAEAYAKYDDTLRALLFGSGSSAADIALRRFSSRFLELRDSDDTDDLAMKLGAARFRTLDLTAADTIVGGKRTWVNADASTAAFSVTLPSASNHTGLLLGVVKTDLSLNAVTVEPDGSELVSGASEWVLTTTHQGVLLYSDGTGWRVVAELRPQVDLPIEAAAPGDSGPTQERQQGITVLTFEDGSDMDLDFKIPLPPGYTGQDVTITLMGMPLTGGDATAIDLDLEYIAVAAGEVVDMAANGTTISPDGGDPTAPSTQYERHDVVFTVPGSALAAEDMLYCNLKRLGSTDTHAGNWSLIGSRAQVARV